MHGVWVWPLVRELVSHMLCSRAPLKKEILLTGLGGQSHYNPYLTGISQDTHSQPGAEQGFEWGWSCAHILCPSWWCDVLNSSQVSLKWELGCLLYLDSCKSGPHTGYSTWWELINIVLSFLWTFHSNLWIAQRDPGFPATVKLQDIP